MCDLGGRDTQSVSRGGVVQKPKDYRHREQACNQQNRRKPHQPPQHDLAFAPKVVVDAFLVWHGWCFLASVAFGALTEGAEPLHWYVTLQRTRLLPLPKAKEIGSCAARCWAGLALEPLTQPLMRRCFAGGAQPGRTSVLPAASPSASPQP